MGRLIDADDVKKMISDTFEKEKDVINSFWKMGTLMDKVDEIQTAYDVDAVVEQLEERSEEYNSGVRLHGKPEEMLTDEAIEIVKGGGVDAN
jgi:hypothetical protein